MPQLLHTLAFFVFPLCMIVAAVSDLMTMTIGNRLNLMLAAAFLVLALLSGMDLPTIGIHVAVAAAVLALAFACFAFGWVGGGDAKFAAATVLWLGWPEALSFIALASVFGGMLTLTILAFRRAVLPGFVVRQPWIARLHHEESGVPYGVALAAAGLAVYPATSWIMMAVA
jgi:prepilin peptidase CpaA